MARDPVQPSTSGPRKIMVVAEPTRESAAALQYALSHAVVEDDTLFLLHLENPNMWKNPLVTLFKRTPSTTANSFATATSLMMDISKLGTGGGSGGGGGGGGGGVSAGSGGGGGGGVGGGGGTGVGTGGGGGEVDFIDVLKQICEKAQPKLKIQVEKVVVMDPRDKGNLILHHSTYHSVDLLVIGQRRSLSNDILRQMKSGSLRGGIDTAEYLIENSKCSCVAVQRKGQNAGFILNTKTHRNFWLLA